MRYEKSPCLCCPDRVADPNCHMTCETFLNWEATHTQFREDVKRRKREQANKNRITIESVRRNKKKRF